MSNTHPDDESIKDLIDRYCAVWNEPSRDARLEMLRAVWQEGAVYADPNVVATGAPELVAHIERVRARRPGASVARIGDLNTHHGYCRFDFHVVLPDGAVVLRGQDLVDLSRDGRIERVVGFFDPDNHPATNRSRTEP